MLVGFQSMARLKPVHAVSDDDDFSFFAQDCAHIRKAVDLVIDASVRTSDVQPNGPICSIERVTLWEPRPGDASRQ